VSIYELEGVVKNSRAFDEDEINAFLKEIQF